MSKAMSEAATKLRVEARARIAAASRSHFPWRCGCVRILGNGHYCFHRLDAASPIVEMYLEPKYVLDKKARVGSVGRIEVDAHLDHTVFIKEK